MINVNIDYKKMFSWSEFKKTITRVENIATVVLIFSLFLPFYDTPWTKFDSSISSPDGLRFFKYKVSLWFIPLTAILILLLRPVCTKEKVLFFMKLVLGFSSIILFLYYITKGQFYFNLGFYLFAISGAFILLGTFNVVQLSKAQPPINLKSEDTDIE